MKTIFIEMPDMNRFEALLCLKSNHLYENIPVIFLTGFIDNEVETQGFEFGVVDFIAKPFSDEEAIHIITTMAGKHFDPKIVEVFIEVKDQFKAVRKAFLQ